MLPLPSTGVTVALAFLATAISTVLAQTMLKRYTARRRAYEGAWAAALAMFAIASAALAVGVSTGWNSGVFRIFYLFGGVLNVAWLALGTVYLQLGRDWGRRVQWGLVFYSGVALGAVLTSPLSDDVSGTAIPEGRELFGALPAHPRGPRVPDSAPPWSSWVQCGHRSNSPGCEHRAVRAWHWVRH